ncbi:sigma-E processing peptidase SpoIIGA [uncultured Clostridium sp.]|uniref:sigma-E processing peptidase SpoIIGA n=1 Tax=uncultured Clostridium sp. TaxID=59620 RepID=UPI0026289F04|nr:sigma-E processing peptidase SpoIIGA [uncultured Clostridium sp.]
MIVYLDVLLIENFLINFFLIVVTIQLLRYKFRYRMLVLASGVGSLYTLTLFFDGLAIFTNIIFKIFVVIIMLKISLPKKEIFTIMKGVLVFFLVSIGFSGFCFLFAMAENPYNITGVFTINNYSSKVLLFSAMLLYLTSYRLYLYIKNKGIVNNFIWDIEFILNGNKFYANGFLDTGNELVEPVTLLPVIIIERRICDFTILNEEDSFRIPYKLVNGSSNVIKGVKVTDIIMKSNIKDEEKKIDAIIALCDTKLSADGEFNALLSRAVL